METLLTKKEKLAAILILCSITVFSAYLIAIAIENKFFAKTSLYHTIIKDGGGLRPGVEISFLGVKIGEVGKMDILEDSTLRVDLNIYKQYRDWITNRTRLIIERRYGIGDKKVKVVKDPAGDNERSANILPIPPGSYLRSVEKMDIVELLDRVDFIQLVSTFEKTVYITGQFIKQIEKGGRIEHMGRLIDNTSELIANIQYIVSESKVPLLELLNDPNFRQSFKSLNRFLSNDNLLAVLSEMAAVTKDKKGVRLIAQLQALLTDPHLKNAIRGANKLFNNADLYSVLQKSNDLVSTGDVAKLIDNLSLLVSKVDQMVPRSPESRQAFSSTMVELSHVLQKIQKTWFMDERTREAFKELVVVLKAIQKTWLLEDETQAVLREQAQGKEK